MALVLRSSVRRENTTGAPVGLPGTIHRIPKKGCRPDDLLQAIREDREFLLNLRLVLFFLPIAVGMIWIAPH